MPTWWVQGNIVVGITALVIFPIAFAFWVAYIILHRRLFSEKEALFLVRLPPFLQPCTCLEEQKFTTVCKVIIASNLWLHSYPCPGLCRSNMVCVAGQERIHLQWLCIPCTCWTRLFHAGCVAQSFSMAVALKELHLFFLLQPHIVPNKAEAAHESNKLRSVELNSTPPLPAQKLVFEDLEQVPSSVRYVCHQSWKWMYTHFHACVYPFWVFANIKQQIIGFGCIKKNKSWLSLGLCWKRGDSLRGTRL